MGTDSDDHITDKIEDALLKRALGFTYEETKTYIKQKNDGKPEKYTEKTTKYCPPDTSACVILLNKYQQQERRTEK